MDKVREWVRSRPMVWMIGAAVVALILGIAIGASGKSDLEDENASLEKVVDAETSVEEVEEMSREELAETLDEQEAARRRLGKIRGRAQAAERKAAEGSITDGTWKMGVDYESGTYRAPGGELCKWEQRQVPGGEAQGEGFNENYGIGEENILIEISSPYFFTQECGTWELVE